jgi:single-strand DNA-binding protein
MNRITIAGNVGREPELKYSNAGMAILKFSVADTSGKDDKKKTIWHSVTAFGDLAENAAASLGKGTRVVIEGKLTEDTYTNKDGVEVKKMQVLADDVMLSVRFGGVEPVQPSAPAPSPDEEPF